MATRRDAEATARRLCVSTLNFAVAGRAQVQAPGGTGIAPEGRSVATETWGQVRPLKLSITVWLYWIWVEVTVIGFGAGIGPGGCTMKLASPPPAGAVPSGFSVSGGSPALKIGTRMVCCTVSIQNVAV